MTKTLLKIDLVKTVFYCFINYVIIQNMTTENNVDERLLEQFCYVEDYLRAVGVIKDIDGVCVNTAETVVSSYNRKFDDYRTVKDLTQYWGLQTWIENKGIESNEARKIAVGIWNSEQVLTKALPVAGA